MNSQQVLDIGTQALLVCAKVAAPFLVVVLAVGVVVGLLQSVTQLQEPTLSFVPKLIVVGLSLVIFGAMILGLLSDFTVSIFERIPDLVR